MELIGSVLIFVSIYDYFTFLKSFFFSKELWDPNCIEWKLSEVWITCSYKWLYNIIIMTAYTHTNQFEDGDNTYLFRHVYMFDYFLGISILKILFVRRNILVQRNLYTKICLYTVYTVYWYFLFRSYFWRVFRT